VTEVPKILFALLAHRAGSPRPSANYSPPFRQIHDIDRFLLMAGEALEQVHQLLTTDYRREL